MNQVEADSIHGTRLAFLRCSIRLLPQLDQALFPPTAVCLITSPTWQGHLFDTSFSPSVHLLGFLDDVLIDQPHSKSSKEDVTVSREIRSNTPKDVLPRPKPVDLPSSRARLEEITDSEPSRDQEAVFHGEDAWRIPAPAQN